MNHSRPRIDTAARRARLGRRHLLAPAYRAGRTEEVADAVVGLHATDPATVHLAACARLTAPDPADVERALYDEGSLVRLLCMRRTLFAVGAALAPVVASSTAKTIAARERAGMVKWLTEGAPGWDERRLADVEARTLAALSARGEATAAELAAEVPDLRDTIVNSPGKPYQATVAVSSRILRVLAAEGRIRRGRPRGGWTSSSYRWRPGTAFAELPAPPAPEARAALAGRWLASYGPATVDDLKWWTGWTLTATRQALAAVGAVEVDLDDGTLGVALPGDLAPVDEPGPWAALLPALDPTAMGWKHRDWYLDPAHVPQLFDRSRNIGPTVWWCGRIIGGWAQRADGEIVWRLLTDGGGTSLRGRSRGLGGGGEAAAAVAAEAARLAAWLGDVRVTPRIRTPLERELSG
ncbi:winged helix DNA-binding domain-containing protein [Streptomyces sp. DSM 41527]|uniref:Winged helix DNA-binding domain-containing protein n=1 Tax=Streptomyces mooreae TaxID=3075523 RepID=A0ABU2TIN0_9ACTN|nr:winged helix DNA-binding domain-containing protein [Streptomyces sp. DSM 41527]MDT0460790.1 winged helix DNA-binding domain-containing protein [Streptomyces sp. DSM 41527]